MTSPQLAGSTPRRLRYSPYVRQPSLSKPRNVVGISGRFVTPLTPKELDQACNLCVPLNTKRNNLWVTNVFVEWLNERNATTEDKFPDILQSQQAVGQVDAVLAAFILEARRKDGNHYPANTLRNILAAIYRVMKENLGATNVTTFMEKEVREHSYPRLHNAIDFQFRLLRCNGIGVERKQASVITTDQEKVMWNKGALGMHSPKVLLQTVFFYNGKNFCLRGRQEHQTLRFSQIVRFSNPDRYTYFEFGSKNHHGGVNDSSHGKTVTIVDNGSPYSHVALLDLYLSKVPRAEIDNDNLFYLSPLPFTPLRELKWYFNDPFSSKLLSNLLKTMTTEAGLEGLGNFTNHSLRATGATLLYDAGIPEGVIQKRTGHKSLDALRCYERTTIGQNLEVSNLLHQATSLLYSEDHDLSLTPEQLEEFELD